MLPLLCIDLRAVVSNEVTASDACEWAAGATASNRLSDVGLEGLEHLLSRQLGLGRDAIALGEIGRAAGAGMQAFHLLGIEVSFHAFSRSSRSQATCSGTVVD